MNPIFERGPSLRLRLFIAVLCSVGLMVMDRYTDSSTQIRSYLTTAVSPLFYIASLPQVVLTGASEQFLSHQRLLKENDRLKESLLRQRGQLQRLEFLQQENNKLRELLGSAPVAEGQRLVAEVLAVYSHPFSHQIVLNKGSNDGVTEFQPLIDDAGVLGQVVSVGPTSSRALLITDTTHAISLRIERTGVSVIAEGLGQWDRIRLVHLPHSTDIQDGDRLITSGLDERFPEGYPVARVNRIQRDVSQPFMQVQAEPYAQLDRIRYVLLLWPQVELDEQEHDH
ncbi:rod shape-determining protein MreC [Alkalimonas collagenimarina]|uniref:Cell shape-determining protein MreC n=1 Tax=Alkalimonas collagenimarina TaxID=400390 RepID=A0ABT9H356_9GAMM|nr:rod shape-determining protein MreC [Alkalimonas collagenimarina]MDP4537755.1 rod shape-determining protein MreC [Alkalimonas collagenimarina]